MVYELSLLHGSSMLPVNECINRLSKGSSLIASCVMNIFLKHLWKNATMLHPGLTDLSGVSTKVMLGEGYLIMLLKYVKQTIDNVNLLVRTGTMT